MSANPHNLIVSYIQWTLFWEAGISWI